MSSQKDLPGTYERVPAESLGMSRGHPLAGRPPIPLPLIPLLQTTNQMTKDKALPNLPLEVR